MLSLLLSGDGIVAAASTTRAQLPLLLNQLVVTTTYAIDQAVETDTAQNVAVYMGATIVQVSQAVETDTAQNITVVNPPGVVFVPVDIAAEADTAQTITPVSSVTGTYPGSAYPGTTTYPWSGAYYTIEMAVETDSAFTITASQTWWRPVNVITGVSMTPSDTADLDLTPVVPV